MKKNFFYSNIQNQFFLLSQAVCGDGPEFLPRLQSACEAECDLLCRRLFSEFITPLPREDLYEISFRILRVFSTVSGLSFSFREQASAALSLLSCDPFCRGDAALARRKKYLALWEDCPRSASEKACLERLGELEESLFRIALKNA